MHVYVYTHVGICLYANVRMGVCVYVCMCVCVCVCVCMSVYVCMCMCVYVFGRPLMYQEAGVATGCREYGFSVFSFWIFFVR